MLADAKQLVWHSDRVYVGVFAVVEVRVRSPDALKHLDRERQRADGPEERKPRVAPVLPKVAVHRIVLEKKTFCMFHGMFMKQHVFHI